MNKAKFSKTTKVMLMVYIAFILLCGIFVGMSISALTSTKTATGKITFALTNSPELTMNVNYEIGAENKVYLGTTKNSPVLAETDIFEVEIKETSTLTIQASFTDNTIMVADNFSMSTNNGVAVTMKSNTNGVAVFKASSEVTAGDSIILDKLISAIYPSNEVTQQVYEIAITSQKGASVPATAYLRGKYSVVQVKNTVTFTKDYDYGTISSSNITVPYGSTYTASGNTLTFVDKNGATIGTITATANANTAQYTYAFNGWSSNSGVVTANTTIQARFIRSTNQYTVTFYNYDGTLLGTDIVDYGGTATYNGTPTRPSEGSTSYEFVGWVTTQGGSISANLTNITENCNVYANFVVQSLYTLTIVERGSLVKITNLTTGEDVSSGDKIKVGDQIQFLCERYHLSNTYKFINADGNEIMADEEDGFWGEYNCISCCMFSLIMPNCNVNASFYYSGIPEISACCVSAETLITLSDGTSKRADEIKVGDKILSYNFETGEIEEDVIIQSLQRFRTELITINFADGTYIKITDDHPLFSDSGWKCYDVDFGSRVYSELGIDSAFMVGDKLFSLSKYFEKEIVSIDYEESEVAEYETYQFATEKNRNYFANGVLSSAL